MFFFVRTVQVWDNNFVYKKGHAILTVEASLTIYLQDSDSEDKDKSKPELETTVKADGQVDNSTTSAED